MEMKLKENGDHDITVLHDYKEGGDIPNRGSSM
jgi:hypothetical protein